MICPHCRWRITDQDIALCQEKEKKDRIEDKLRGDFESTHEKELVELKKRKLIWAVVNLLGIFGMVITISIATLIFGMDRSAVKHPIDYVVGIISFSMCILFFVSCFKLDRFEVKEKMLFRNFKFRRVNIS